jgi:protein tyrosine phosphatase (PTP) superfamily phosphohydrolase (DUF442 family)
MQRVLTIALIVAAGCSSSSVAPPPKEPIAAAEAITLAGLENTFRVTPALYSGGSPETDAAFEALAKLGVKTIISVDGSTPEVEMATKHGMTYIHLPVGYDGIPTDVAYKIARILQMQKEPIYLHCHHGKHRGPAAIAAARCCLEPGYQPGDAQAWLTQAGTDAKYKGLMNVAAMIKRPTAEQLQKLPSDFPAKAEVKRLTQRMVHIDAHWDAIRAARAKDFTAAEPHAVLLAEDYHEAARMPEVNSKGRNFLAILTEAETAAAALAKASKAGAAAAATEAFLTSQRLCAKCHSQFRD